jgi:hypothetical protein
MSAPQDRSAPTSNEWCTHKAQSSGQELQPTTAYRDDEHAAKPVEASFEGCKHCGGASICEHNRISESACKDCGHQNHNRLRSDCKDCGGTSIC